MTPSHCIFKLIDNRLSCGAVELPEEPSLIGYTKGTALKVNQDYKEQYQQALANAIWFREEKDIELVKTKLWLTVNTTPLNFRYDQYQPEQMKPYKLPTGLEIEIRPQNNTGLTAPLTGKIKNFAFLKPKEQEKEESQNELWDDLFNMLPPQVLMPKDEDKIKSKFTISHK